MAKHWPYSEAFNRRYLEYKTRSQSSVKEIADALGVAVGTLNSYRRKHDAITPENTTLLKASKLFGCDIFEFMPDYRLIQASGKDIALLNEIDIYRISEQARMVTDPQSTQEERDMMVQAMREFQDKLVRMRRITLPS